MNTYTTPAEYWGGAPTLGVPSQLTSSVTTQLKGARSTVRSVAAATGTSVGPSSTCLFQIPQSLNDFIVPGSVYIRGKVVVTQTAADTPSLWAFAGNNGSALAVATNHGVGGAASLVSRYTITLPGGTQMAYANQDHWTNAVVKPFALSRDFVETDLAQSELAGVTRLNTAAGVSALSRTAYFTIPVDVPLFQSEQAVPLLLMSGGISLEIITNTVNQAFSAAAQAVSDYQLSNLSLIYETVTVSPEFKQALVAASASSPFSLAINDRISLGAYAATSAARLNVGVGLSSLKSLIGCVQPTGLASTALKTYINGGLYNFVFYINGETRSIPNIDNDSVCFAELQRSIGGMYDANMTSCLNRASNIVASGLRNNYCSSQFAFGASFSTLDDGHMQLRGTACDQASIQWDYLQAPDTSAWQDAAGGVANATCYLFAAFDSVISVQPDGTCVLRK